MMLLFSKKTAASHFGTPPNILSLTYLVCLLYTEANSILALRSIIM